MPKDRDIEMEIITSFVLCGNMFVVDVYCNILLLI